MSALERVLNQLHKICENQRDVEATKAAISEFNAMKTELESLRKATQWQEMESAPKDGTDICVKWASGFKSVAAWRLPTMGEPQCDSHYKFEWRTIDGRYATPAAWLPLPKD